MVKKKKIETVFQDTAITVFLNHVFVIPSFLHIVKTKWKNQKKNHLDREFPRKHKTYTLNSYNSTCFKFLFSNYIYWRRRNFLFWSIFILEISINDASYFSVIWVTIEPHHQLIWKHLFTLLKQCVTRILRLVHVARTHTNMLFLVFLVTK